MSLVLAGVSAAYEPAKPVLDSLSLEVSDGEIVAVLGPSGCGKSTLLLLAAGFLMPATGTVRYQGQVVSEPDRQRVLLTQSDSTWPWKTALDNVAYPLRCQGASRADANAAATTWLSSVGLAEWLHVYPGALSGGMRQRVGVAKVFALRPDLLLLDEPFGALDNITRLAVNHVFLNLWLENRMTTLLVTHSIDEALFLADRLIVLNGRPARIVGDFRVPRPRPARLEDTFSDVSDPLRVSILRLLQADSARG